MGQEPQPAPICGTDVLRRHCEPPCDLPARGTTAAVTPAAVAAAAVAAAAGATVTLAIATAAVPSAPSPTITLAAAAFGPAAAAFASGWSGTTADL